MKYEEQLKLQSFLDGELPEGEAREIAALVAREASAADLLKELRNTRKALSGFEPDYRLPESREFFWSKINREIRRLEPSNAVVEPGPTFSWLRRILVPTGAVAAVALVAVVTFEQFESLSHNAKPDTEMTIADSGAFTYHDYANGTTLVWVSYPAQR